MPKGNSERIVNLPPLPVKEIVITNNVKDIPCPSMRWKGMMSLAQFISRSTPGRKE